MADERKTYKYIDTDIDQKTLLSTLKHNARSYVRHNNWDEGRAKEFYNALTEYENAIEEGRISTSQSGSLLDSAGKLTNGTASWRDNNGQVISQEDYDALSKKNKKKYSNDFEANGKVAEYIGIIADAIYKDSKKKPSGDSKTPKFDLATHGLWDKFTASMAPTGSGDLEAWLDLDPYDAATKKRGTANRAEAFSNYIDEYLNQLPGDLDFSGTTWGSKDAYVSKLRALQTELANGISSVDYRLINQLGGTPEAYRAFFTTEQTPPSVQDGDNPAVSTPAVDTPGGGDSAELRARLNNLSNRYMNKYNSTGYSIYSMKSAPTGVKYDTSAADKLSAYMNALNKANVDFSIAALQQTNGRPYINYLEQYGQMNPSAVRRVSVGKYAGWYYIPESLNQDDFSVLAYNPNSHRVARLFYGNLGSEARADYTNILRSMDSWEQTSNKPFFQEGGQIQVVGQYSATEGGSIMDALSGSGAVAQFDQMQKGLSTASKSDPKTRKPGEAENNYNAGDGTLTANDYARLGAVAADIVALIDPEPFSALALGIGSDITNLVADINEGYGFWNTAGNFAAGLGLSAVGVIPIFGDAVGSGGKVVKTMVRLAPKVTKALTVSGLLAGISNGDEIIKSISKIGKDGPENEMTVEDWRNIGLGIQLVLGGANAVRNAKTVKNLNERGKSDMVDVLVTDKATGKKTTLRFGDKNDVKALRDAKTVDDANAVINGHKSLRGKYEVATKTGEEVQWFDTNSKWYKPWSWRSKTSTTGIKPGAIRSAIDYQKLRNSAANGSTKAGRIWHGRENYIAQHGTPGYNPSNNITPQGKPSPRRKPKSTTTSSGTPTGGSTPTFPNLMTKAEVNAAMDAAEIKFNQMKKTGGASDLASAQSVPHSVSGKALMSDQGMTEQDLFDLGLWKQGGVVQAARRRYVHRAQEGENTKSWMSPWLKNFLEGNPDVLLPGSTLSLTPKTTDSPIPEVEGAEQTNPTVNVPTNPSDLLHSQVHLYRGADYKGKEYGTGYTSTLDYSNGEYGTANKVNISGIKAADGRRRSPDLTTPHLAEGYDYTDAQLNTTKARQTWQAQGNREKDFVSWVRAWRANPSNASKSQQDMLADYNNLIDSQYTYKHEMGTDAYTGSKAYRNGDAVAEFNKTNKALYGSANAVGGVHGYSTEQEPWNGTETAQRFIDITDSDVYDLNWNNQFTDNDSDDFKDLFKGLTKDATGRYYTVSLSERPKPNPTPDTEPSQDEPSTQPQPAPDGNSETTPAGGGSGEEKKPEKSKNPINWGGLIQTLLPNTLAVSRYLLTRQHNKEQFNIAKRMPVMLYDPKERTRWLYGDVGSIQRGYRQQGELNHIASTPLTADGQQQTAAQLTGFIKSLDYIDRAAQMNDSAKKESTEANWQQEGLNQDSRYSTAMKNRENLFQKRANVLQAEGTYRKANYTSLDALLGQFELQAKEAVEENKAYNEAIEKASLQNDIAADLSNYGINATEEEQELVNNLLTGKVKLSDLSDTERATYTRLSNAIDDEVTRRWAAKKGSSYRPFTPKSSKSTAFSVDINYEREGGKLEVGDSEKVTIQKLRGRIQRMKTQQEHFKTRLNAYEKDLDRAQRSMDKYIRGQLKK